MATHSNPVPGAVVIGPASRVETLAITWKLLRVMGEEEIEPEAAFVSRLTAPSGWRNYIHHEVARARQEAELHADEDEHPPAPPPTRAPAALYG